VFEHRPPRRTVLALEIDGTIVLALRPKAYLSESSRSPVEIRLFGF
jgi:hypothetical protein